MGPAFSMLPCWGRDQGCVLLTTLSIFMRTKLVFQAVLNFTFPIQPLPSAKNAITPVKTVQVPATAASVLCASLLQFDSLSIIAVVIVWSTISIMKLCFVLDATKVVLIVRINYQLDVLAVTIL